MKYIIDDNFFYSRDIECVESEDDLDDFENKIPYYVFTNGTYFAIDLTSTGSKSTNGLFRSKCVLCPEQHLITGSFESPSNFKRHIKVSIPSNSVAQRNNELTLFFDEINRIVVK